MTALNINKTEKGFTLIELLVVIGILAILLAITLIAINPARQFGQANDTKRKSDINAILNGVGQFAASNGGNLPTSISGLAADTVTEIDYTDMASLCADLVPTYIPALPTDPIKNTQAGISTCTGNWGDTGYQIERDANNRITVLAPSGYAGTLSVTR